MTKESIMKLAKDILDYEGWTYEVYGDEMIFVAAYGSRKWRVVLSCAADRQLCCYAAYPWSISTERLERIAKLLNELNLEQGRGCFIINPEDGKIIYRCGTKILDEYSGREYVSDLLLCCIAVVNAYWDRVLGIAQSA